MENLKHRFERVGGKATTVTCSSSPSVHCDSAEGWNRDLEQKINALSSKSLLSDWYGKIQLIKQMPKALTFTIPIEQSFAQNGRSGTLVYCELDLAKIEWRNLLKAGFVSGSFLGFVLFVVLLIADYGARIHEQDRAFQTVAGVMQDAPAPYVRLDSDDRFLELNDAFAKLIGYASLFDARLRLKDTKFVDLLVDDDNGASGATYGKIDECRRNGTPTNNYQISLKRIDGGKVTVTVHGAAVPNPINPRHSIPQTFGIIIPVKSDRTPVSEMPLRDAGRA